MWYKYETVFFFFSSRRRHTRCSRDWSSDVCSSDLPAPGRGGGVAANDRDVVGPGELEQSGPERLRFLDGHALGAGERDQGPARAAAHRRDVREVHRERLPPHIGGRRVAAAEVDVLDEEIRCREHETPGARLQDGTVVADPDADSSPSRAGAADDLDQLAFGGARAHGREVARKFFRSCLPSIVRIDSGWNCTPSTGWRRWRSPMISPSSATAVTSSVPGTVSVKTA